MTQEDKQLLLQDLCARLPYGVKVSFKYVITSPAIVTGVNKDLVECNDIVGELEDIKPYLFPLSSMTEEQKEEYDRICMEDLINLNFAIIKRNYYKYKIATPLYYAIDWLNKHHFDYRGLIEKSLALDATDLRIYDNK